MPFKPNNDNISVLQNNGAIHPSTHTIDVNTPVNVKKAQTMPLKAKITQGNFLATIRNSICILEGGQLFGERRKHVISILEATKELSIDVREIISNYCFQYDILVTTNKMMCIYLDFLLLYTDAEVGKDADLSIPERNIDSSYILVKQEQKQMGSNFCSAYDSDDVNQYETLLFDEVKEERKMINYYYYLPL